jgi:uncharacterized small protein (DUF1192 family)
MAEPIDDDLPKTVRPKPKNLDPLSISDLEEYIEELNGEIARAKTAIEARRAHRSGIEALFKPKT